MSAARLVIGHYGYKWSCHKILSECKWPNIQQMIDISTLKALHSLLNNTTPVNLYNKLKFGRRQNAQITLHDIPKTKKTEIFYFYQGLKLYNNLPKKIKMLSKSKFKFHVKYFITNNRTHVRLK